MKFILEKSEWISVGKGALIAIVGSLLTYFTAFFAKTNFGEMTPIIVAVWSVLVNIARKWISSNNTETK